MKSVKKIAGKLRVLPKNHGRTPVSSKDRRKKNAAFVKGSQNKKWVLSSDHWKTQNLLKDSGEKTLIFLRDHGKFLQRITEEMQVSWKDSGKNGSFVKESWKNSKLCQRTLENKWIPRDLRDPSFYQKIA